MNKTELSLIFNEIANDKVVDEINKNKDSFCEIANKSGFCVILGSFKNKDNFAIVYVTDKSKSIEAFGVLGICETAMEISKTYLFIDSKFDSIIIGKY